MRLKLLFLSLILGFIAFLSPACIAQQQTLTPAQAAAIQKEQQRWNAELQRYGNGFPSITYVVDSVQPATRVPMMGPPPAGTLAVRVVEHHAGGRNFANQGFMPVVYWIVPQSNGTWLAGKYDPGKGMLYVHQGDLYPTEALARAHFHEPEIAAAQNAQAWRMFKMQLPVYFIVFMVLFGVPGLALYSLHRKSVAPLSVTCPACSTKLSLRAGPCENCGSKKTRLERNKSGITLYCRNCKQHGWFDNHCPVCDADLSGKLRHR